MHKVSVIIPVYNRFDLLQRALLCLQHQSVLVDEVVVSDDGSAVDMLGGLRKLAPGLPFQLKYVRHENKGFRAAKTRNNGVRHATGDYLLFLDQDIVYTKNFVESYLERAAPSQFLVAWPIRLTEAQSNELTDGMIQTGDYTRLVTRKQRAEIGKQFRKDLFYYCSKKLRLRSIGPKLRGGLFSVFRVDYLKVNGFDEMFSGWGNEDDDMGRRLHAAGVMGKNVFYHEYPVHVWHPPHRVGTQRVNLDYYQKRIKQVRGGDYYCRYGIDNPREGDDAKCVEIK